MSEAGGDPGSGYSERLGGDPGSGYSERLPGDPGSGYSETLGGDPGLDMAAAAATLQSAASDSAMLLKLLADELAPALGNRMVVERSRKLLRSSDEIRRITVRLGDDVLEATLDGTTISCSVGHGSGGIRIRNEQVDMATWLTRLLTAVQSESERSEAARQALERIVIGGTR